MTATASGETTIQAERFSKGNSNGPPSSFSNNCRRDMSTLSWICVVLSLFSALFLFALDQTVVADVQPRIIATFGHVDKLPWVSVGYPLGAIVLNLLVSNLFVLFDNKRLFIVSFALFEVGSAICGAAPNMNALIVGRVACGVGGIGIYAGSMNLLSVLTTETERPIYLTVVGLTWGAGTILGPIIGGSFANSSATWRWSFYINLCIGAVMTPVYLILLPSHKPLPGVSFATRVKGLDWTGAILNAAAIATLVMGISFGGGLYIWSSPRIIGLFACSGVLWILFTVQQALALFTTREDRLFPVNYLASKHMSILFAQTASAATVTFIPIYFIPLFCQFIWGDSALRAGVRLLPLICFQVLGTILSGAFMQQSGYYLPIYVCGGILSLVGGILLLMVDVTTTAAAIYGYSVLVGLGAGLYVQASYPVAQLKVKPAEIPKVIAFLGYGQISGITLALSISSSAFLNTATNKIAAILPSASRNTVKQAITGTGGTFFATLSGPQRELVLGAISRSIGHIYGMVVAAAGLTLLMTCFMKLEKLPVNHKPIQEDLEKPSSDINDLPTLSTHGLTTESE